MKYKVGDEVKIVQCLYGHGYDIGDIVVITDAIEEDNDYKTNGDWFVEDDEIELHKHAE